MKDNARVRICQLTTIDTNVGDDWIREGICYLVERSCPVPVEFRSVNIHDWKNTIVDEDGNDKVLSADGVMMAGTPFYFINERKDLLRKISKAAFSVIGRFSGYSIYDGRCSGAPYVKPVWYDRIRTIYKRIPVAILAAGTNLRYESDASELIQDRFIRKFLTDIHCWSRLNTVREHLAGDLLAGMGINHYKFPCTAFWAMDRIGIPPASNPEIIAFNFMPGGGHFRFERSINPGWQKTAHEVFSKCVQYFGKKRIRFICHDQEEADAATSLIGAKYIWYEKDYKKTIERYRHARTGIVNRCHALIAMAGFGSPSIVVGKDSRTLMATEVGLPRYHHEQVDSDDLVKSIQQMYETYESHQHRLSLMKSEKEAQYVGLLKDTYIEPILNSTQGGTPSHA